MSGSSGLITASHDGQRKHPEKLHLHKSLLPKQVPEVQKASIAAARLQPQRLPQQPRNTSA
eukprot:CAMPEP_0178431296 /NCGR_PEP_ID=MMETSP0689_2-20121128/31772_1 /TAXON_ID=160604 /ORGANISM="Amphidinium massartii, Strain CS-259" /LENGTH=60 /DNA_ID=CAMNT_0020053199 /DNA_START=75 /DNA_END=254 /DNA_ORIENTATION=-